MSGRFPEDRPGCNGLSSSVPTPDHTLSCALCHSPLQEGRVLPNCLHSCCRSCLEREIVGPGSLVVSCPASNCGKPVNTNLEELSSTAYTNIMDIQDNSSDLISEMENKLNMAGSGSGPPVARYGPVAAPVGGVNSGPGGAGAVRHSPPGLHHPGPRQFEADWRPLNTNNSVQDAWSNNPLNFNPLGDLNILKNRSLVGDGWGSPAPGGPTNKQRMSPGAGQSQAGAVGQPQVRGGGQGPTCNCGDGHLVTSRCRDCNDDLCDSCVVAHQRVKLTRDHTIVRYPDNKQTLFMSPSSPGQHMSPPLASVHPVTNTPANADVLRVFNETVERAKQENEKNIALAQSGYIECEKGLERISKRTAQIGLHANQVSQEIKQVTQRIMFSVKEREDMLLKRLDRIRIVKQDALMGQEQEIRKAMFMLDKLVNLLETSNRSNQQMDIIEMNKTATETINTVKAMCGNLEPTEDVNIQFNPPSPELMQKLATEGLIVTSGFAPHCSAEGDGLHKGVLGREAKFCILTKDHVGELTHQTDNLQVFIKSPDNRPVYWEKRADGMQHGRVVVRWRPHVEGEHVVHLTLQGRHIQDSPFHCMVKNGRDYNNVGAPVLEFSKEGSGDGDLCRPWGICCTPAGLLCVADRSNNRICFFNKDGTFNSKFGTEGSRPGQFNRPAGVCIDKNQRLIVTDKDNHRMQIFTLEGEFLLKFGERGSNVGQFMYPWDVACNSKNQILVSDTRNHRLQLFSPAGEYLTKYGFDGQMWKHFDSPRGVCFTQDDQAIVTDFNNHRLLVIKSNFCSAQFLGCEGNKDGEFTRPNGVTVDDEGNIIVADSRNHRIQVFSSSGVFLKKFGTNGTGPGELDRPCGVCMTSEGFIAVVDFGNTRVSLF